MATKKNESIIKREVNMHLALIAVTLCAGLAAGLMHHQATQYIVALDTLDRAVLGAMTEEAR